MLSVQASLHGIGCLVARVFDHARQSAQLVLLELDVEVGALLDGLAAEEEGKEEGSGDHCPEP